MSKLSSLIVLMFLAVCAGCAPNDRIPDHLYLRLNFNPTTLDPALIVDVAGGSIAAKLFNGLVRLDPDMHVVPDIAASWTVSGDSRTFRFLLRKGVKFSNGQEVTADDFRYTFERVLRRQTKSPNTWVFDKIKGAEAFMNGRSDRLEGIRTAGPYEITITLEKPFSPFLNMLTMTAAYVVPRKAVEESGPDFSSRPIGTGPFRLLEWKHNNFLHIVRNDKYFDRVPLISGIIYRIIPEDLTAVTEFELGNIDLLGVPGSEFRRFRESKRWSALISSIQGLNTYYLGFNCSRPPFNNPELRRAVAGAIDTRKILETFYDRRGRQAYGPVPENLRQWQIMRMQTFAPEKSKKILSDSKLHPQLIKFYITYDQEVVDIAEIIQSYLKSAGLNVEIRQLEWSAYKSAVNRGEADMFWLSWWADYPDPENFLFPLFHSSNHGPSGNRSFYTNHEVDRLIEAGQTATRVSERNSRYREAEQIIVNESPWVFFWHKNDFIVRQKSVKGYVTYPIYSIDKGTEVSL